MLELDVDEVEVGGKATDEATEDKGAEEPRVDDTDDEDIGAGLLMDDATEDTGATELAAGGGVDPPDLLSPPQLARIKRLASVASRVRIANLLGVTRTAGVTLVECSIAILFMAIFQNIYSFYMAMN